jgi:alcohol dehydrogenase
MIEHGRAFAAQLGIDSLIGLGGGSSLDAAKGVNFVLTNGGTMKDYWGYGKATQPLLPMLGIPATTGTGSEAQSYALISDPATHVKMACGDPMASFRYAVLDPLLTLSQPPTVRAAAGYDALSHAVESYVTTKRTQSSQLFSRQAWDLLHASYAAPATLTSNANLQLGAWFAGCAIEASMLGAAHACANPLTARYADLHPDLAGYLAELATGLALPLRECGVTMEMLPQLAHDAAQQWTGRHNPRPFDAAAALELYQCAY